MANIMNNQIRLQLACGPNPVEGWENIDILDGPGIIKHDLREPLPYKDSSVDAIFHEHFIEHLEKADGEKFLMECFRVLKSGGVMRMGWPDLAKLIDAYNFRSRKYKDYVLPHFGEHKFGDNWDEIFSDCLFDWEHRYAYTAKHLKSILEQIGFENVEKQSYKKSKAGIALDFRDDPATTFLEMKRP